MTYPSMCCAVDLESCRHAISIRNQIIRNHPTRVIDKVKYFTITTTALPHQVRNLVGRYQATADELKARLPPHPARHRHYGLIATGADWPTYPLD
jgi:hypothetical protein